MINEEQNNTITFKGLIANYKVVIPIIQRDYAQGRDDEKAKNIRNKFLTDIFKALKQGENLHLDFVYGSVKEIKYKEDYKVKVFTPLDGQQRLTTLFLLYWYFGENENLVNFTYETRASSREFCEKLVENIKIGKNKVKENIKNQSWFMSFWEQDPSVRSMLNMLDSIEEKAEEINKDEINLNKLTFSLMIISDYGLDDDLYIKMNARGKPLNEFENFKADFEKFLDKNFKNIDINEFKKNIDTTWTDNFFKICKEPEKTFKAMVNYKNFLFEMLYYKNNDNPKIEKEKSLETSYQIIEKGQKELSNIFKENDKNDLDFLNFAFSNIEKIIKISDEIFVEYWDGKESYNKDKVYIFRDGKDNFNKEKEIKETKNVKKSRIIAILPYFDLEEKIYLYSLIRLLQKSSNNSVSILTEIRNKIHKNENFYYYRRTRVKHEQNNIYDHICSFVKNEVDVIIKENKIGDIKYKKIQDYKYFQGNIDILEGISNKEKIIEIFNQETHKIIAILVCYGFKGWVIGGSSGGKFIKKHFGGVDTWHMMLTRKEDWGKNEFGGLKEVLKQIAEKDIKEIEEMAKEYNKNTWEYYFIKYSENIFNNDKNIFVMSGNDNDGNILNIRKLKGINPGDDDEYIFEIILKKKFKDKKD